MIVVIDYNVGNVKSVCNAFRHIGCEAKLSRDITAIENATGIVLPGVAAFGYAISALGQIAELIKSMALSGKPLLGICVGYQMLFDTSSEYGRHQGLGLVGGNVGPIPPGRVIPHMGWNQVHHGQHPMWDGIEQDARFYFVHSYHVQPQDTSLIQATSQYPQSFVCAVGKDKLFAVQFHPEKSQAAGLKLLQNFMQWNP